MAYTKPVLSYHERTPPYAIAATAALAAVDIEFRPDPQADKNFVPCLKLTDGDILEGIPLILKYLARCAPAQSRLYDVTPLQACRVDQWVDFACTAIVSGPGLEAAVSNAAECLALSTFAVGHALTLADVALWGALHSAPMWGKVKRAPSAVNVVRWFEFCNVQPELQEIYEKLNPKAAQAKAQAQEGAVSRGGGDTGSFDIGLPDAQLGKVVTRFPPEPSGYLHIGHAKAALLNQHFADMYKGTLRVRFDDTNPSKESSEFVQNIMDDMQRLGLRYDKITYTSDYFPEMVAIASKMIKAGMLYADNTDVETMRAERLKCQESKNRNMDVEETERIFAEMQAGSEEGCTYCLRVRMDMKNVNACLRDPVVYRCNDHRHWRTGSTYKCYPTYDFACPFVDSLEGVTHALRTSEYKDREEQFYRILAMMRKLDGSLPHVHIWDYSRLNFVHTVLSKRKLQKLVDTGVVTGWTDPRFPTVQGILRRGMHVQALREFILSQGASRNATLQEWDKIWTINKKIIDPIAPRHTGIVKEGMVPVKLRNGPDSIEYATVPKHKKNPDVGKKTLCKAPMIFIEQVDAAALKEGEEVTLMDWGNCIMHKVERDSSGAIASIDGELHLAGDFKKTKLKLTWLADTQDLVPLCLVDLGHLITKPKLEEEDVFEDFVNRESWKETEALGDANMRALQVGDIIQLERKGFYKVDAAQSKSSKPLLLLAIPDGRQKK